MTTRRAPLRRAFAIAVTAFGSVEAQVPARDLVEPDSVDQLLVVITAFPVDKS